LRFALLIQFDMVQLAWRPKHNEASHHNPRLGNADRSAEKGPQEPMNTCKLGERNRVWAVALALTLIPIGLRRAVQ
jgi:hypothetical protein